MFCDNNWCSFKYLQNKCHFKREPERDPEREPERPRETQKRREGARERAREDKILIKNFFL